MEIPRRLWRHPTGEAIAKLAARFDLRNTPDMQDWEYEVADPERVDEFLGAYESGELSDDERFTLMETIIESLNGCQEVELPCPNWLRTLGLIEKNIELHIYTVCYWACLDLGDDELDLAFYAAADMRAILRRHAQQFGYPFPNAENEDEYS